MSARQGFGFARSYLAPLTGCHWLQGVLHQGLWPRSLAREAFTKAWQHGQRPCAWSRARAVKGLVRERSDTAP